MMEEVILDLKVNEKQALDAIGRLSVANADLKKQLQEVNDEEKKTGTVTEESAKAKTLLTEQIKANNDAIKVNTKELKSQSAEIAVSNGSINEMRAKVKELNSVYSSMSATMRESEAGKRVQSEMKMLNESINEASLATSNFKDNVGNYPNIMGQMGASNNAVVNTMQNLGISATTTAGAFGKTMVGAINAVGVQMKALMANPLILGLSAIIVVVMAIVEAIKRSDTAMTAVQVAMAPIMEFVDFLIKGLTKVVEAGAKALEWIMTLGGKVESDGQKAVKLLDKIEEKRRENSKKTAEDDAKIAEAREKASDKENYTAEDRKKALVEAKNLEEEQIKRRTALAEMELKQFRLKNKQNNQTDEYLDKEAELEANIIKLKQEQSEVNKTLLKGQNGINNEIEAQVEAERKANEEKIKIWKATQEERKKIQEKVERDLHDLIVEMMKEGEAKEIEQLKLSEQRKIDALKLQLATEKNLTDKARADLTKTIQLSEQKLQNDIQAIKQKYIDESKAKQDAIDAKTLEEKTAKELQQQADAAALKLETRRLEVADELAFELETEQAKNQALLDLKKEGNEELLKAQFATLEAYELAVLESSERLKLASKSVTDRQKAQQLEMLKSVGSIAGSMSELFGSIAGDSKALAGFQKAMGMVEILTNMAVGISGAIKAGAGVPFPANLVAIASGVGSVVTGITSAIALMGKSNEPPIPSRLSDKGSGGGSGGSISVPTFSVPTASVNPTLASQSARSSEQNATNMDVNASSLSNQPTPVVEVREISQGLKSVEVKENLSKF